MPWVVRNGSALMLHGERNVSMSMSWSSIKLYNRFIYFDANESEIVRDINTHHDTCYNSIQYNVMDHDIIIGQK